MTDSNTNIFYDVNVGTFVTLMGKDPKNNYYNGTYFVTSLGPGNRSILVVKPEAGYASYQTKTMSATDYDIVDTFDDFAFAEKFIREQIYFSETIKRGEKANWVEHVYGGAATTAREVKRALDKRMFQTQATVIRAGLSGTIRAVVDNTSPELKVLKALAKHLGVPGLA